MLNPHPSATNLRAFLYSVGLSEEFFRRLWQRGITSVDALALSSSDDLDAIGFDFDVKTAIYEGLRRLSGSDKYLNNQPGSSYVPPVSNPSQSPSFTTETSSGNEGKRKYVRKPKKDSNAPLKPKSAYVQFSTQLRRELGSSVSFADASRIAGERWAQLGPRKEALEKEAAKKLAEYHIAFRHYQDTPEYAEYQKYLEGFRDEQAARSQETSPALPQNGFDTSSYYFDPSNSSTSRMRDYQTQPSEPSTSREVQTNYFSQSEYRQVYPGRFDSSYSQFNNFGNDQ